MRRILGILIMMIISVTTAMSQQMPITVTPILTPPYLLVCSQVYTTDKSRFVVKKSHDVVTIGE